MKIYMEDMELLNALVDYCVVVFLPKGVMF